MYVVVDSNILVEQGFGNGALVGVLLTTAELLNYQIAVPELVIEEVTANFRREVNSKGNEAAKVNRSLSLLLNRELPSLGEKLDSDFEATSYRKRLRIRLEEAGAVLLQYPATNHEDLVRRANARSRPFDNQGSGYRDALIWESVLELATRAEGEVILLSSDKAFSNQKGELHPDLVEDLSFRCVLDGKVTLVGTLRTFLDDHVRPRLTDVIWDDPVSTLGQFGLDLEDELGLALQAAYEGQEWYPAQFNLPGEYETLYLDMAERVSGLGVVKVSQLPKNKYLVTVKATFNCTFDVFIFKGDWYIMEDPDLFVWDPDWNDHYVAAEKSLALQCTFDLVIDTTIKKLDGIEVTSADPI